MIAVCLLNLIHRISDELIKFGKHIFPVLFNHFLQGQVDIGSTLGIINRSVMMLKRYIQVLGYRMQLIIGQMWQQSSCKLHSIHMAKVIFKPLSAAVLLYEGCIEGRIVRYKECPFTEFHELRQYLLYRLGIRNHIICY